ncbi:MAG: NAD-dependent epimerase/dehydratase family protein [Microgenomates group bacterium]
MIEETSPKRILVTGAAGFIGSHLTERLLEVGHEVTGVDNFITGNRNHAALIQEKFKDRFIFIEADASLSPASYLDQDWIPDIILHFASPASPPKYSEHPKETYQVNAFGTHAIAEYLLNHNPGGRLLFASTSEVYGEPLQHPQRESYWGNVNPNGARSCYDEAKRFGEMVCGVFHSLHGLDTRLVRIFNTYGPRMDLYDGRVIPNIVLKILEDSPIEIYGDGSQTRSFCYVDDLVSGIVAFALDESLAGETINLGNPSERTVLDAAEKIAEIFNEKPQFIFKDLPKDDPTRRCPDISKANALLTWQPQTSFEEGIHKTITFFQNEWNEDRD